MGGEAAWGDFIKGLNDLRSLYKVRQLWLKILSK